MACPFCAVNRLAGRVVIAVADGLYVFGLWLMRPVDHRWGQDMATADPVRPRNFMR